MIMVRTRNR